MHSYPLTVNKLLPVITMSILLLNTAAAEEAAAPACLTPSASEGNCCSGHAHPDGLQGMDMFERMSTEIALTDTQKQELAALLEMYRPRIKELAERGMTGGRAMLEIAPNDASYNTRAAELSQLAGASAAEMVTLLTELQANAFALLTTEQQAKFLQLRAEQRQKMEAMRASMQAQRESGKWPDHYCMRMPAPATDSTTLDPAE